MGCASVGKVVKHKSMLAEPSCLWTIGVETNFRTYEPCREHEGDAPLSMAFSPYVSQIFLAASAAVERRSNS